MNKENETFVNTLKETMHKDDEAFINCIEKLYQCLSKKIYNINSFIETIKYWDMLYEIFLKDNFSLEDKLILFLKSSIIKNTNIPNDIRIYVFTYIIRNYISKYPNEILKILNNEQIQIMYSNWFKMYETSFNQDNEIYKNIFKLPKFKEIVLDDYDFIIDFFKYNVENKIEFIPNDYLYLIGSIDSSTLNKKDLYKIYNKYFGKILSKNAIDNLIFAHNQLDSYSRILNNDRKYKKIQYINCLKDIQNNPKCYQILKDLSKKYKIDFEKVILFYSKYKDSEMFLNLLNLKSSTEISKKIIYLANSKKILNISQIKSLDETSFNDLVSIEKSEDTNVKVNGGPNSNTKRNIVFFENGSKREIRRIDIDGSYVIKSLSEHISHFEGVKIIYKDYVLDKTLSTTLDIAIEMIKKLNSITFILEKEICFIVIPSILSIEQIDIINNWLLTANKKGKLGIIIYNKENNKKEVLSTEFMNINEIVTYINDLKDSNNKSK